MPKQQIDYAADIRRIQCRAVDGHQYYAIARRIRRSTVRRVMARWQPRLTLWLRKILQSEKPKSGWETDALYR